MNKKIQELKEGKDIGKLSPDQVQSTFDVLFPETQKSCLGSAHSEYGFTYRRRHQKILLQCNLET